MIRTSLINGVINLDSDFSKYIESLSKPGVIEGFNVQDGVVKPGKARVKAERTNGETIYCYVENTEDVSLSGNDGKVYIVIDQEDIDSGLVSEDGSNIARIEEGNDRPTKNFLKLWSKTGAIIKDEREMVKTIESVQEDIESISEDVEIIDGKIEQIETQGVPTSSLTETGVVGELYTLDDELYLQDVSEDLDTSEGLTVINVGYDKEETHIQRIANGISGNSVSLYIAKVGSPVTNFTVEVRKGIYAEADGRAYWTGDETQILASKSISYSSFTTDFQKITITFDDDIELQEGDLIDVVCYQSGISDEKIKSTTDYFIIGGYSNRLGEGNSVNYVDNGTVTKTNIIGYCDMNCVYSVLLCNSKQQNVDSKIYQITNLGVLDYTQGNSYTLSTFTNSDTTGTVDISITTVARSNYSATYKTNIKYSIDGGDQTTLFSVNIRQGGTGSGTISVPANSTVSIIVDGYNGYRFIDEGFIKYNISTTILKKLQYVLKPTTIVPVTNKTSMVSEGTLHGKRYSQPIRSNRDLPIPTLNTDFYLDFDAIIVCNFSHMSDYGSVKTCKIKQDGIDYRIRSYGGATGDRNDTLNQIIERRLRGGHTYQIDFNPSSIKEFYIA